MINPWFDRTAEVGICVWFSSMILRMIYADWRELLRRERQKDLNSDIAAEK